MISYVVGGALIGICVTLARRVTKTRSLVE
jgi:hypothetical protein